MQYNLRQGPVDEMGFVNGILVGAQEKLIYSSARVPRLNQITATICKGPAPSS